jgi:AraC family transcriptional regulator of adaptative response/methylated-DNA-[protein]-cysteine methyltransferase
MENLSAPDYDFKRIQKAIEYIQTHFKSRPPLDEVAEIVHLSPFHFQRLFKKWAGISPKQFIQYLSLNYAKSLLSQNEKTLFDTSLETGLSGTSRLHDLFIKIEGMTPGEYKNGGENLNIEFSYQESPFGEILVASTDQGICHISFIENRAEGFENLKSKYPRAHFMEKLNSRMMEVLKIFSMDWNEISEIKLHLKATPFQLKVWEALLSIPLAHLSSYSEIAEKSGFPKAQRAIGSAIGDNPVAYLIPCHRVIRTSGELGGYHWGLSRKAAIIGWEAAKIHPVKEMEVALNPAGS